MINTTNELRCKNPACDKPVIQIAGHRKREYCSDTCKQTVYKARKKQPRPDVTIVDDCSQAIQGLEQVQERFREYVQLTNEKLGELAGQVARYRQQSELLDRGKMEARFMDLGQQVGFNPLTPFGIFGGHGYWFDFMKRAKDETLLKAIGSAEYYLEGLIALRGDPRERHITELERQVKDLQAQLNGQVPAKQERSKSKKLAP